MNKIINRVGLSTNLFKNPFPLDSCLEKIAEDFSIIEIEFENEAIKYLDDSCSPERINALIKIKKNHDLNFSVHAPYIRQNTNIASDDAITRNNAVKLMLDTLRLSAQIGAKTFTFHPGFWSMDKEQGLNRLKYNLSHSLDIISKEASRYDITICLENTGDNRPKNIFLSFEDQLAYCRNHNVKITLDLIHYTSFINPENENYYSNLLEILDCIGNVHFADMQMPKHVHLPLGKGDFPYMKVLSFLYANGYEGNSIIEERGGGYQVNDYLDAAKSFKLDLSKQA